MLYVENHDSISDAAKKELLNQIVSEYMLHSEYTYDTSDPGYEQVINLIYESANYVESKETENETKAKTKKNSNKAVTASENVIVPIPKISGKIYTAKNIGSFKDVLSKFYIVTEATSMYSSDLPLKNALSEKFKISGSNKKPQILIYHTHSQEEFCNSNGNTSTTIIGVGDRLAKILEQQFGYNVIHDTTEYDIVDGKLDRNEAYDQARVGVKKILEKYPSISLVLDIHRDGINENTRLVTEINGKKTAQIMFFNGMSRFKTSGDIDYLYNPYLYENLALSLQMKVNAEAYYPGFTRRNYVNAYKYNLDLCKQCMLIEVGAQTNTYQEARNAAEPLAMLINLTMGKK
jgi:stage II sporulation protein P